MRIVLEIPKECKTNLMNISIIFGTIPERRVKELAHLLALSTIFERANICFRIFAVVMPIGGYRAYAYYILALPIVVKRILRVNKQYILNVLMLELKTVYL